MSPCLAQDPLVLVEVRCSRASILKDHMDLVNRYLSRTLPLIPSTFRPTSHLPLGVFVLPWVGVKAAASMAKHCAGPVGWGSK